MGNSSNKIPLSKASAIPPCGMGTWLRSKNRLLFCLFWTFFLPTGLFAPAELGRNFDLETRIFLGMSQERCNVVQAEAETNSH